MEIAFLIIGLLLGALVVYFALKNKIHSTPLPDTENLNKISELEKQLLVLTERNQNLNKDAEKSKAENSMHAEQIKNDYENRLTALSNELKSERAENTELLKRLGRADEIFKSQRDKIQELTDLLNQNKQEHRKELEELQNKLTAQFENIANKVLEEKSQKFTTQNKENIDIVLNPLKERIKEFESKVEKAYQTENAERATLKAELKQLMELNKQVSDEANNLARALKGDNKMQGNWGEVILEKVLERSGLTKGVEYYTQFSSENQEGKNIKPDVIVNLPENKHLVIDSKVSLIAYEAYINADSEDLKDKFLKEHILSVKNHIKGLSEKNYQTAYGINAPDFVLLFIPLESSFSIAVQADADLFSFAWDKKIVLVSPSTLLATLRTIASVWKQEKQNKNAMEIAQQAGVLYDKFVALTSDMDDIKSNIEKTLKSYDNAWTKIEGRGGIASRIENLKKLGAKTQKNLPNDLLTDDTQLTDGEN